MSSKKSTTSKDLTDIYCMKERSKEYVGDQITFPKHSTVPNINNDQKHSKEPIGVKT